MKNTGTSKPKSKCAILSNCKTSSNNKQITDFFSKALTRNNSFSKNKNLSENANNNIIKLADSRIGKNKALPKAKQIEFFDEFNGKMRSMPLYEEKDFKFFKSKIFAPIKVMALDDDVMTEDEQAKDAFNMLKDNLKETIKLAKGNNDYLTENVSYTLTVKKE